jgi:hypothetical protein
MTHFPSLYVRAYVRTHRAHGEIVGCVVRLHSELQTQWRVRLDDGGYVMVPTDDLARPENVVVMAVPLKAAIFAAYSSPDGAA